MSITVSQDLLRSSATPSVLLGRPVRATGDATDSPAGKTSQATPQGEGIKAPAAVLAMLDAQSSQTLYDEPGQRQQKAVSAYQDVLQQDKKEQLQQMFAIDLYA